MGLGLKGARIKAQGVHPSFPDEQTRLVWGTREFESEMKCCRPFRELISLIALVTEDYRPGPTGGRPCGTSEANERDFRDKRAGLPSAVRRRTGKALQGSSATKGLGAS